MNVDKNKNENSASMELLMNKYPYGSYASERNYDRLRKLHRLR